MAITEKVFDSQKWPHSKKVFVFDQFVWPPPKKKTQRPQEVSEKYPSNKTHLIFGHLGVSKNRGTSKSSILIGSIVNHPFWGTSIFGNTHLILGVPNVIPLKKRSVSLWRVGALGPGYPDLPSANLRAKPGTLVHRQVDILEAYKWKRRVYIYIYRERETLTFIYIYMCT